MALQKDILIHSMWDVQQKKRNRKHKDEEQSKNTRWDRTKTWVPPLKGEKCMREEEKDQDTQWLASILPSDQQLFIWMQACVCVSMSLVGMCMHSPILHYSWVNIILNYCTLNGSPHPFSSSNRIQFMERHNIHGDILKHFHVMSTLRQLNT